MTKAKTTNERSHETGESAGVIQLQDDISLKHIKKLKRRCADALNDHEELVISGNNCSADLTLIQLLISLQKTGAINGKKVKLDIGWSDETRRLIEVAGFDRALISKPD